MDPITTGLLIIGSLLGIAQIGVGIGSVVNQKETSEANAEYTKETQQQVFAREDSALQRAKADAQAAGFSPLVAVNNPANAGQIISSTPYSPTDYTPLQSGLGSTFKTLLEGVQTKQTDRFQSGQLSVNEFSAWTDRLAQIAQAQYYIDQLNQSDDQFSKDLAFRIQQEQNRLIDNYLNRQNAVDIANINAENQIKVAELNNKSQRALENLRSKNQLKNSKDLHDYTQNLQILLQDNQLKQTREMHDLDAYIEYLKYAIENDKWETQKQIDVGNTIVNAVSGILDALIPG